MKGDAETDGIAYGVLDWIQLQERRGRWPERN